MLLQKLNNILALVVTNFKCHLCVSSVGLLDAVHNLTTESLGQVIHLTWDAPFSLDITEVDPDIWYRVDITVGNISLSTYEDITISEFNFTMDGHNGTNTSVIYQFRVTPINGAGDGTTSAPVTGYFSECKLYSAPKQESTFFEIIQIL